MARRIASHIVRRVLASALHIAHRALRDAICPHPEHEIAEIHRRIRAAQGELAERGR